MSRTRRYILSNHVYEICFRTREDLPFATIELINLLLEGIVARTQRDSKVKICHNTWMGNHPHFLIVVKDAAKCVQFYQEVKKKVTDTMKRLTGLEQLNLWEIRPGVIQQLELGDVISKIVYIYSNPTTAYLVNTIDEYPGLTTWKDFIGSDLSAVSSKVEKLCLWIQLPMVPTPNNPTISKRVDEFLVEKMKKKAKRTHELVIEPNAWMECFGITEPEEVRSINEEIISKVREAEEVSRKLRESEGKRALGVERLKAQPVFKAHKPKKRGVRVFLQTANNEVRMKAIAAYRTFCRECAYCYEKWKVGDFTVVWPPGAFLPPVPPLANALLP